MFQNFERDHCRLVEVCQDQRLLDKMEVIGRNLKLIRMAKNVDAWFLLPDSPKTVTKLYASSDPSLST